MTKEQKIKVLAELDGWQEVEVKGLSWTSRLWRHKFSVRQRILSEFGYLTSYDAIIPLIQKQPKDVLLKAIAMSNCDYSIELNPEQLADALIKAVGKWEE